MVIGLLLIVALTFNLAKNQTMFSANGDDKDYYRGAELLAKGTSNMTGDEKHKMFYFHLHKPLIIFPLQQYFKMGVQHYWWTFPYFFYLLAAVGIYLVTRRVAGPMMALGAMLILSFNSVWMYFGFHLFPDVPAACMAIWAIYFMCRSVQPQESNKGLFDWILASVFFVLMFLFRMDFAALLALPFIFITILYVKYRVQLKKDTIDPDRVAHQGKPAYWFFVDRITWTIFILCLIPLFLLAVYVPTIENQPAIHVKELFNKLIDEAEKDNLFMKQNGVLYGLQGQVLFPLSEMFLTSTLLVTIAGLVAVAMVFTRWGKVTSVAVALALLLLILGSLATSYLIHFEQRYTTRFVPMLAFLAIIFVQVVTGGKLFSKDWERTGARFMIVCLLILSSYCLIHWTYMPVRGMESPMLTITVPAAKAFQWDQGFAQNMNGCGFIEQRLSWGERISVWNNTVWSQMYPPCRGTYGEMVSSIYNITILD